MQNIQFSADIRLTRLPFVSITEGTFKGLNFIVDTGSTDCILFAEAAKQFGDAVRTEGVSGSVSGIEANPHKTLVVFCDMIFGGQQTTLRFNLYDGKAPLEPLEKQLGFQLHGILGIDFMLDNGWVIDIIHQCIIVVPEEESSVA